MLSRNILNKKIKFYILVPVYRTEKYVRSCIESVRNQTYQDFEMILVDDGSPDNAGQICDEFASRDIRITVIHQRNMGPLAARQSAIKFIESRLGVVGNDSIIVFLDSDDTLKVNALETLYFTFLKYDCDMVIYGMDRVLNGQVIDKYCLKSNENEIISDKKRLYKKIFSDSSYNPLWRKAISSQLLSERDYSEWYHIFHAEDLLQSIDYYKKCKKAIFLKESLYNYTVNPESITQTVSSENFKINFTVRQKVMEFLSTEKVFDEKDWKQYRTYCISILCDLLITILKFPVSWKRKINWFEEIWNSDYFRNYIKGKEYEKENLGWEKYVYILYSKKICWLFLIWAGCFVKSF